MDVEYMLSRAKRYQFLSTLFRDEIPLETTPHLFRSTYRRIGTAPARRPASPQRHLFLFLRTPATLRENPIAVGAT